jgi:hypothetical protein
MSLIFLFFLLLHSSCLAAWVSVSNIGDVQKGKTYTIKWTKSGTYLKFLTLAGMSYVDVKLKRNRFLLPDDTILTIQGKTASTGSKSWAVPTSLATQDNVYIQVCDPDSANLWNLNTYTCDQTADFSVYGEFDRFILFLY